MEYLRQMDGEYDSNEVQLETEDGYFIVPADKGNDINKESKL